MRAIVCDRYGAPDVLEMKDRPTPRPGPDGVLVRVHAAAANSLDYRLLAADPFFVRFVGLGLLRPKHEVLGADVAGTVVAVGEDVRRFRPGDAVFGDVMPTGMGGFAQYVCTDESHLEPKPDNLTFEEAAAVPVAGVTALQGLRDHAQLKAGDHVLITGAGGGVGTFAVQVAKALGAEVTAVCSTAKVELVRSLGADRVVDYTRADPLDGDVRYDAVFDVAAHRSILDYRRALGRDGIYVMVGGATVRFFQFFMLLPWMKLTRGMRMAIFTADTTAAELAALREMLEAGRIAPVIGDRYTLGEVPDAIRVLADGHATGKLVVTP